MSSDFNFTVTSWFLWNFLVKPYFNAQCPSIFWHIEKQNMFYSMASLLASSPRFSDLPMAVCSRVNKKSNQTFRIYLVLAIQIDLIFEAFHCDLCRKKRSFLGGPSFCTWHMFIIMFHTKYELFHARNKIDTLKEFWKSWYIHTTYQIKFVICK